MCYFFSLNRLIPYNDNGDYMIFENENILLEVSKRGAEIKRLFLKKDSIEVISTNNSWGKSAPLLFPVVGVVDQGYIKHEKKIYRLNRHAFVREKDFEVVVTKDGVEASYTHKRNDEWPFEFVLKIYYLITNKGLNIKINVIADDKSLYNLGWHPAFNLKEDIKINTIFTYENHNGLITKMRHCDNDTLRFKDIENDRTYIFDWFDHKFKIQNKSFTLRTNDMNACAIWTSNKDEFICIEPWAKNIDGLNNGTTFKTKEYLYGNNEFNIYLDWEV